MKKTSSTMLQAIRFAIQHNNKLIRHPGGFWCDQVQPGGYGFGTKTVQALVSRGFAEYSEWKDGKGGKFPVQITLTQAGIAES